MAKPIKPSAQQIAVAHNLFGGDCARVACRKAGYRESTVKAMASKIAKSEKVQRALQEIARNIRPGELTELGKGRIKQKLISGERNDKEMLSYIRTGAEMEGSLGGPSELHLHQHSTLPPTVQRMLEEKMRQILNLREGVTINVESTDARDEESPNAQGERCSGENQKDDGGV